MNLSYTNRLCTVFSLMLFLLGCSQKVQAQYIYEVYTQGGLANTSIYSYDYIVLAGFAPNASLTSYSIQYRNGSTSSTTWNTYLLTGNADAYGIYRIQANGSSNVTANLPFTVSQTIGFSIGHTAPSSTLGPSVLLVNSTTAHTAGTCPSSGFVDKFGYVGTNQPTSASICFEGTSAPTQQTNGTEIYRRKTLNGAFVDNNNNANDFDIVANAHKTGPTITTAAASSIAPTSATLGGDITGGDGANFQRGIVYGTSPSPTTSNTKVAMSSGTGTFSQNITGLSTGTTYYVRSYMINALGIKYGNEISFVPASACTSPTAYNVTGTGAYCTGGTGVAVGLSNSETGVTYQLNGVGTAINGTTGSAITFGNQTAGTYTVVATRTTGGCTATMTGNAVVTNNTPTIYTVTGTSAACPGGTGLAPGLSGSQSGVSYQLKNGASNIGSAVAGTGSTISFGTQSAGTYTVEATQSGCVATMTGNAVISTSTGSVPTTYAMTGGGSFCAGGTGVAVGLANSETGVTYQLQNAGSNVASVSGTGSAISFPNQTTAATYTVVATTTVGGCVAAMTSNAVVVVNALPIDYNVTGGGAYCTGGTGVVVGLSNSQLNVNYQLKDGASNIGSFVSGTGSAISFPNQTTAATYTVVATSATGSCTATMTGNAVVTINPSIANPTFTAGATTLCEGATSTYTATATNSTSIVYSILNGTGASINASTGIVSNVTGNFTVVATASGCNGPTTANRAVAVDAKPSITSAASSNSPICPSATLNLSVGAAGAAPLSYAWSGTGTFTNGTTASPTLTGAASGNYTVTVSNSCGTTISTAAVVVYTAPSITSAVSSNSPFCSNASLTLSVVAAGSPLNYAWSGTGTFTNGTTASPSVAGATTGNYTVTVSNTCGSVTSSAAVTTKTAPTITSAASSNSPVCPGAALNLNVGATGSAPLSYSWFGIGIFNNNNIANPSVTYGFGSDYVVTVSNSCGSVTSTVTASFVTPPTVYNVTGGGPFCNNTGTPVPVGISATQAGVNYSIYKNGVFTTINLTGNGGPAHFSFDVPGLYTIRVIDAASGCTTNMYGSATITNNYATTPDIAIELVGPSATLAPGTKVTLKVKSQSNIGSFQWYKNGSPLSVANDDYNDIVAGGGTLTCVGTSNSACPTSPTVTSNAIAITETSTCNCNPGCSNIPTTAGTYDGAIMNTDASTGYTHYCDANGLLLLSIKKVTATSNTTVAASAVHLKITNPTVTTYFKYCGVANPTTPCMMSNDVSITPTTPGNAVINRQWHIDGVSGTAVGTGNQLQIGFYFRATEFNNLNSSLGDYLTLSDLSLYVPKKTPILTKYPDPSTIALSGVNKIRTYYGGSVPPSITTWNLFQVSKDYGNDNQVKQANFIINTISNSGGIGRF
jgi:hypothetical protein